MPRAATTLLGRSCGLPNLAGPCEKVASQPITYDAGHMYNVPEAFASPESIFLRGMKPVVLATSGRTIDLGNLFFAGPSTLGEAAFARRMFSFNPSIARAPATLCAQCKWVASLRVEALHQCDATSPLLGPIKTREAAAWFRGTAIALLNERLELLGWTWLLNSPTYQVSLHQDASIRHWSVPLGAADNFHPMWTKQVYDARVFNNDGHMFITYNCLSCSYSVSHLHLRATPTSSGGLRNVRAWTTDRHVSKASWAEGRNQALFSLGRRTRASDALPQLYTQTWLGVIGSWGSPGRLVRKLVQCHVRPPRRDENGTLVEEPADSPAKRFPYDGKLEHGARSICGALPMGAVEEIDFCIPDNFERRRLRKEKLREAELAAKAGVLASKPEKNHSAISSAGKPRAAADAQQHDVPDLQDPIARDGLQIFGNLLLVANNTAEIESALNLTKLKQQHLRVSLTANLQRISSRRNSMDRIDPAGPHVCEVLLGIGHAHRGAGPILEMQMKEEAAAKRWAEEMKAKRQKAAAEATRQKGRKLLQLTKKMRRMLRRQRQTVQRDGFGLPKVETKLQFGYRYTHFFYALQAKPPFRLIATSCEFCLASHQRRDDCESVQFISGLEVDGDRSHPKSNLLLTYGVNDCEAKIGKLELAQVWRMLHLLPTVTASWLPMCGVSATQS